MYMYICRYIYTHAHTHTTTHTHAHVLICRINTSFIAIVPEQLYTSPVALVLYLSYSVHLVALNDFGTRTHTSSYVASTLLL